MSEHKSTLVSSFQPPHASLRAYVTGFVSCVVITLVMYLAGISDTLGRNQALGIIGVLAIVQFMVQLRYFLHLGDEFRPRWKLGVFALMLTIVFILVGGSLWIMSNLNYRMMHSSSESSEYVKSQDGL